MSGLRRAQREQPPGPIALVAGTRPEVIKLFSVYRALKKRNQPVFFVALGQHASLLQDALNCFSIQPDFFFEIMKKKQDLFHITGRVLVAAKKIFKKIRPSLVVVQGDTTTAMTSALAAFYYQIPVVHVEAGLRTGIDLSPYPEEINRKILSELSLLHFAPSEKAKKQLLYEGISEDRIFVTGNTGVDALFMTLSNLKQRKAFPSKILFEQVEKAKSRGSKIVLLTMHRRESHKNGMCEIFHSLCAALKAKRDLCVFFPVHPNPAIRKAIEKTALSTYLNLCFLDPLPYIDLVYLLNSSDCVMTDSGGIQEEAVSLNKPVIVLRNESDRLETKELVVGTENVDILKAINKALRLTGKKRKLFPYGDGSAGERIARHLESYLQGKRC